MQDLRSIQNRGVEGIGGRIFGGSERRLLLRPSFQNQSLKCPRCDSLNTKFCYYNNYNLSQPRHFCKNCRRYWTKGGVLRNVPVGGGCRKSKKSKQKAEYNNNNHDLVDERVSTNKTAKTSSHSNSDESSSTSLNTTKTEDRSTLMLKSNLGFSQITHDQNPNPSSVMQLGSLEDGLFQESESFSSLMMMNGSENSGYLGFNLADVPPFELHNQEHQQQEIPNRINSDYEGLSCDLPVIDQSYWNQSIQWNDNDHPLYLP